MMPGVRNGALRVLGPLALAVTASACQPTALGTSSAATQTRIAFAKTA
jgi:hypothetical protein